MEMIITLIFVALFFALGLMVIFSLKRPGSRYRLKKDYGLTDRQIDERFGSSVVNEKDLEALDREKKKKVG